MEDRPIRMDGRGKIDPDVLSWEQFRKQPVVIDATIMPNSFEVETPEGTMQGDQGDMLIRGVEGEYYPCDSDVFAQTYYPDGGEEPETDGFDEDDLFNAFVSGFMHSSEGANAESPHSFDEDRIREALGEPFYRWVDGYRKGDGNDE
jgi:hypothetical protein